MSRVLVGMSGGVDSSVAAALIIKQGHEVTGVTMKLWSGETVTTPGGRHGCYGPNDAEEIADAQKVAQALKIPWQVIDLSGEYRAEVLDFFCEQSLSGRTPNPCVRCNHRIKFGGLLTKATEMGLPFDYFATGHYARVEFNAKTDRYLLKKARDAKKDQTYFLSQLSQAQLSRALFPLGDMLKSEVKKLSEELGLNLAEKPESQDFVEEGYHSLFKGVENPGQIVDVTGKVLGKHKGLQYYTIGQRKGLGIASRSPMYVVALNAAENQVIVGDRADTLGNGCIVSDVNWISCGEITEPITASVKIRYAHPGAEATITPINGNKTNIKFTEAQSAITPGQAAVFYDGDVVLGGGTIEEIIA